MVTLQELFPHPQMSPLLVWALPRGMPCWSRIRIIRGNPLLCPPILPTLIIVWAILNKVVCLVCRSIIPAPKAKPVPISRSHSLSLPLWLVILITPRWLVCTSLLLRLMSGSTMPPSILTKLLIIWLVRWMW